MRKPTFGAWTWRVTTPDGIIEIPGVPLTVAIRKAGLYGMESIQPATAEEHAAAVAREAIEAHSVTQ